MEESDVNLENFGFDQSYSKSRNRSNESMCKVTQPNSINLLLMAFLRKSNPTHANLIIPLMTWSKIEV